jgi:methanol metabolism-related c-type cytochrome
VTLIGKGPARGEPRAGPFRFHRRKHDLISPARAFLLSAALVGLCAGLAYADGSGDPKPVSSENGKYLDKDGTPTFSIKDGKVDWYTYVGYVRYAANCLQCHGPDGLGSTYAPSLVNALQHLSYNEFLATVASGRQAVSASQQLVMPALGDNKNVMCYIDAIYVYLRARSNDALGRQRPDQHEPKPAAFKAAEDQCMG